MIKIADSSRCCGCSACVAICPHGAIQMQADRLGFPYPVVDGDKCVDCGLCDNVCVFVTDVEAVKPVPMDTEVEVLAARHLNPDILSQSQSGGAFTAIADQVLKDDGVVYGAAFDSNHIVRHIRVSDQEGLGVLRGSKYVQSDLTDIFIQVKSDLADGLKVLFAGTPCQVAGLKSYIPKKLQEGLLTVDFICHGVPSPAIWKDYLSYVSRRGKVVKANFRDKNIAGWKEHKETFIYSNGVKRVADTFRVLFYKNIMLRHSCAVCPYHILNHKSDVTIADFWGVEEHLPQLDGPEGTSMVVCNSEKGQEVMKSATAELLTARTVMNYDFMARRNPNLVHPAHIDKDRMAFENEYACKGFVRVARRWGDLGLRYRLWLIKRSVKNLLNKCRG